MKPNRSRREIYIRNGIVFLILYLFMMGLTTYLTADALEKRMRDRAVTVVNRLDEVMGETGASNPNPPSLGWIYNQLGMYVRDAASERVYIRAGIYNGWNEPIAKTGNTLIVDYGYIQTDSNGNEIHVESNGALAIPGRYNRVLLLDDYLTVDEINALFAPKNLWYILYARVTGTDDGQRITPQKIELFNYWNTTERPIISKDFDNTTENAVIYGGDPNLHPSYAYFEHIVGYDKITKTDQKRYADCDAIAEPSLTNWRESGAIYDSGIRSNIFRVRYSNIRSNYGWGEEYSRYLSFGLEYYPLEAAVMQLIPVYVLSFIFIAVLLLVLSSKMNAIFTRQAELENSRRELTNAFAHELKTPLGVIRNYSEGLLENINEEKRDHYLDVIIRETERLDDMVLEMLALSRLETGDVVLRLADGSVREIADAALARYIGIFAEKDISAENLIPADAVLNCDPKMIGHVFANFLSNAARHTPAGGQVRLELEREGTTQVIGVENTGSHIPEEMRAHIWDAYYKTDTARARSGGVGIGLSIAGMILKLHHFDFGADNTTEGVKFWFSLTPRRKGECDGHPGFVG